VNEAVSKQITGLKENIGRTDEKRKNLHGGVVSEDIARLQNSRFRTRFNGAE